MSDQLTEDPHRLLERLRQNYEDHLANVRLERENTRAEMRELIINTFNDQVGQKTAQLMNLRYWAPRFELQSETHNHCAICSVRIDGIKPDNGWINRGAFAEEAAESATNYLTVRWYWKKLGFNVNIIRDEANEFDGMFRLQIIVSWPGNSKRGYPKK